MKLTAIIQARMSSTRLPGKVLKQIGPRSMLAWVVRRTQQARLIDQVVVATTSEPGDEPIVQECAALGVPVYRGSKLDVLDRYYQATLQAKAEAVVRITSDCPLIDPGVADEVCQAFLSARPDYASNRINRRYPRGLDCEVVTMAALERTWREAAKDYERVHVTPYIYDNPDQFQIVSVENPIDYSQYRWTVDTPEDLAFVRAVTERLGFDLSAGWQRILDLVEKEPALAEINSHIFQKKIDEC